LHAAVSGASKTPRRLRHIHPLWLVSGHAWRVRPGRAGRHPCGGHLTTVLRVQLHQSGLLHRGRPAHRPGLQGRHGVVPAGWAVIVVGTTSVSNLAPPCAPCPPPPPPPHPHHPPPTIHFTCLWLPVVVLWAGHKHPWAGRVASWGWGRGCGGFWPPGGRPRQVLLQAWGRQGRGCGCHCHPRVA
jgi:hypothetical protein